jgi:diguanylate cyclase (GGDEF)-like protein
MAIGRILRFRPNANDSPAPEHAGRSARDALLLMQSFEDSGLGWFWATDAEGRLTYVSPSFLRAQGDEAPLVGQHFAEQFRLLGEGSAVRRSLPFLLAKEAAFEKVAVAQPGDAARRCWSISGTPRHDASGRFVGFHGSAIDITEQRRSSEHASQLAQYDPLTGLPNRRRMAEVLDARLGAIAAGRACAVMLIDLDRFKQVNDTLGHPAGDELLKQVAKRLCGVVGDREKVFRLGGDEFQVILDGCDDRGVIGTLAMEMIRSLSQPYLIEGSRCIIGASVGIALAPVDGTGRADLIRNADLALYASKTGGRGRFRFFSTDLLKAAEDKRALEDDLRDALAKGELSLAYQPVVSSSTNRISGVEALMRWDHPSRGQISPAVFIPIAEEAGLVPQLGEWALRTACAEAAQWPGNIRVAVNVSPIQFMNTGLPAIVASALSSSGLAPDRLELEITEGVFLGEGGNTDTMFAALKGLGVRLALDDFGTGYSSLGYLRNAPFDKIKIDQTFVREATAPGSRNSAIIAAIVALADALDMETTAEGIEYMDQLKLIRSLKVSHVQGWVYSKAISSAALAERLEAGGSIFEPSGPARQRSTRQAVLRKVGVVHENFYVSAMMRNLSDTGALIEGLPQVGLGTRILVDFGDGQLVLARVTRQKERQHGIAFEQPLVDDGNGGLCTRQRVSRYLLHTANFPSPGDPDRRLEGTAAAESIEAFATALGLDVGGGRAGEAAEGGAPVQSGARRSRTATIDEVAERYLRSLGGNEKLRAEAGADLNEHVLPRFGALRLDQINKPEIMAWLTSKADPRGSAPGTGRRLQRLMKRLWDLAIDLNLPGAEINPLEGSIRFDRSGADETILTLDEAERLLQAASLSQNRQLKFALSLLMLTGARPTEILTARWEQVDLSAGTWRLESRNAKRVRELRLVPAALRILADLPRTKGSAYILPNPTTGRPYGAITKSWEVVKRKADLEHLELDDLRYCDFSDDAWTGRLHGLISGE